jgi:hypothetical protein
LDTDAFFEADETAGDRIAVSREPDSGEGGNRCDVRPAAVEGEIGAQHQRWFANHAIC